MDKTFSCLKKLLINEGRYEDTVFVLYGDHGDELWGHHIYNGHTHAFEPYLSLCNTPLIIHTAGQKYGKKENFLIGTSSVCNLIRNLLEPQKEEFEFDKFVYSRNLFSRQSLNLNGFNKSYTVTDGKYSLMVSHKGLEMYLNKLDFTGSRNFLDFFKLSHGTIKYIKRFSYIRSAHYRAFMIPEFINELESVFNILKGQLSEHISMYLLARLNQVCKNKLFKGCHKKKT